ncbi:DUF302 domain-containing protein [Rhodoferax sp.]|uniref:DUF302 domain-containing protein n=1 Tax=Rhodoferax sp. TaxID=50421 RepID=UPI00260D9E41|nr:DUF302 domain-containing protein [Rhodoferax sp.]MDD2919519.1 DUF302 domain-containing protein [Rhodoferax sp.]
MSYLNISQVRAWLLPMVLLAASAAYAQAPTVPGTQTLASKHDFKTLVARTEAAIGAQKMGLVASASASAGAAGRGITIPGNTVLMVFRNDFAVRMLQASVPAGIEAPIRLYVTENADGTASLSYRTPSAVFAPYKSEQLDAMAVELDPIFERIVRDATGG